MLFLLWLILISVCVGNEFNWELILEVVKLFVGIFIMIGLVIVMFKVGVDGLFVGIVYFVNDSMG